MAGWWLPRSNLGDRVVEASYLLDRPQCGGVAEHEYSHVVLAAYGHHDEVEGDLDIDAFLLRLRSW